MEIIERLSRFIKLMPSEGGEDLIVLKGHLLIEEVMSEIIDYHLDQSNPLNINLDNIMFSQKLNLCWALVGDKLDTKVWIYLKKLNSIRNSMAHSLEPNNMSRKINDFIENVIEYADSQDSGYEGKELEFSISWLFCEVNSHLHKLRN